VCLAPAAAQAQPGDTSVLYDDFESGTLANWTPSTSGNGLAAVQDAIGTNGSKAVRLTVPDYSTSSMAYVKHRLASGSRGGCPPRLPQNRACAVHTRLLGTAGCEPRRRPS